MPPQWLNCAAGIMRCYDVTHCGDCFITHGAVSSRFDVCDAVSLSVVTDFTPKNSKGKRLCCLGVLYSWPLVPACLLVVLFLMNIAHSKAHAGVKFGFKKFPAPLTHIFPKLITPVSCAKNPGYVHMTSASRFRVGLQSATYNAMSYHCVGDVLIRHHVVIYLLGSSVLGRAITSVDCPHDSGDLYVRTLISDRNQISVKQ